MGVRLTWRLVPLFVLLGVVVSVVAAGAFGHDSARTATIGNAAAGKAAFTSAGCGGCHVMAAAGAKGSIGPSLDSETLTEAKIITQITNGGYGVMGVAAKKQYPFPMSAFKGKLTTAQIQNIAAFVFTKRTGKAAAAAASSSSSSSSSSSATSSTASTGSSAAAIPDNCPSGLTIVTVGNTDNDTDETGAPSDNDGCI